jgi:hypothetical protein
LAGCTPAEPASASPAGFIFTPIGWNCKPSPPKDGGIFDRQNEEFSVGIDNMIKAAFDVSFKNPLRGITS